MFETTVLEELEFMLKETGEDGATILPQGFREGFMRRMPSARTFNGG